METSGPLSVRFGCSVSENIIELGNIYALILGRNLIKQFRASLSLCWLVIEKLWSDRQLCHPDRQNSNKEKRSLIECTGANWFSALSPLEAPFLCATFRASAHLVSYSPVLVGRHKHRKTIVGFRFCTKEAINLHDNLSVPEIGKTFLPIGEDRSRNSFESPHWSNLV